MASAHDFTAVLALVAAAWASHSRRNSAPRSQPPEVRLLPLPTYRRTRIAYRRGAATHPAIAT